MFQRMTCPEIYAYWDALRGEAGAPMRSQIEPAALRAALPDLFMLEAHANGDLTFRLVGTRVCALFGRELRAHSFHELWAGGHESNTMDIVHGAILHESPVAMNLMGFFENGDSRPFDMLLLPIRSPGGRCDRLLGALIAAESEDRALTPHMLHCLFMDRCRQLKGPAAKAFAHARPANPPLAHHPAARA